MPLDRRRLPRSRPPAGGALRLRSADAATVSYNLALRLVDLHDRGACVETSGRLRPGQRVLLELTLPDSRLPVRTCGVIRWSRSDPGGGRPADLAGIQFERGLMAGVAAAHASRDPQRRHRRFVPIDVGEARCLPADLWSALGLRRNPVRAVHDLSLGGVRFETLRPLPLRRTVRIRLEILAPRAVIEAEGQVRWCRRDTLSLRPRWWVGIVFQRLASGVEAGLRRVESYYTPRF